MIYVDEILEFHHGVESRVWRGFAGAEEAGILYSFLYLLVRIEPPVLIFQSDWVFYDVAFFTRLLHLMGHGDDPEWMIEVMEQSDLDHDVELFARAKAAAADL